MLDFFLCKMSQKNVSNSNEFCYKVGMSVDHPFYVNECVFADPKSSACAKFPGISVDFLITMATKFNVCVEPWQSFGYSGDCSANDTSVFGDLLNGRVDLTVPISETLFRYSRVPFVSTPVAYDRAGFLYKR